MGIWIFVYTPDYSERRELAILKVLIHVAVFTRWPVYTGVARSEYSVSEAATFSVILRHPSRHRRRTVEELGRLDAAGLKIHAGICWSTFEHGVNACGAHWWGPR
jgi:hypothetical protein